MTLNLLKRLESSVDSFRLTLRRLASNHHHTLAKIEAFKTTGRDTTFADVSPAFEDTEPDEDENFPEPMTPVSAQSPNSPFGYGFALVEHDLRTDLTSSMPCWRKWTRSPQMTTPSSSTSKPKSPKARQPINPGNRKILLFHRLCGHRAYLYEQPGREPPGHHQIHTGIVTGSDGPKSTVPRFYDFQSLLTLFSPR